MLLKEIFFMGSKRSDVSIHVITTGKGIPIEFMVTADSIHDNTTFQIIDPENGDLYSDAVYLNQQYR
jgi:hypothetical protein